MKKFTKILLIGCLLVMVSCNNWLDVDPKSQVKDKDLFASEMGLQGSVVRGLFVDDKRGVVWERIDFRMVRCIGTRVDVCSL